MRYYVYKFVKGYMYKRVENPDNGFISSIRAGELRNTLNVDAVTRHEKCVFIMMVFPSNIEAPDSMMVIENPVIQ